MTQAEIAKFLITQTVITMNDIDANKCIKEESKQKIADAFHIELEPVKTYSFKAVIDSIAQAEAKRKEEAQATEKKEEKTPVEKIVQFFKLLNSLGKTKETDNLFIVREINRNFSKFSTSDILAGINEAAKQGFINNPEGIIREYHYRRSLRVLNANFEVASQQLENNQLSEADFLNRFSNFLYQNYKQFGVLMTPMEYSFSEELYDKLVDRFYERLAIDIDKKYSSIKLRGNLLAKEIFEDFENLDKYRIFAILSTLNLPSLNIDRLHYQVYCIDEGEDLLSDLNKLVNNGASTKEILELVRVRKSCSEYPKEFMYRTLEDAKKSGISLPYDEISKVLDSEEEIKESEEEPELQIDLKRMQNLDIHMWLYVSDLQEVTAQSILTKLIGFPYGYSEEDFLHYIYAIKNNILKQSMAMAYLSEKDLNDILRILRTVQEKRKQDIQEVLIKGSKQKWTTSQFVSNLKKIPNCRNEEIIIAITRMKQAGLILTKASYEEIIDAFKKKEKPNKQTQRTAPEEEITPQDKAIATLSPDGKGFEEPEEKTTMVPVDEEIIDVDYEPISTGKRHKVIAREKAKSSLDKKTVIAAILVALGAASTAVLSTAFGVNPISAAKNTVTSIMSVASRNPALAQILPATVDFVKNLAVFGLAATGTIAWLKRKKEKDKSKREAETRELLEKMLQERDEAKEGGKKR